MIMALRVGRLVLMVSMAAMVRSSGAMPAEVRREGGGGRRRVFSPSLPLSSSGLQHGCQVVQILSAGGEHSDDVTDAGIVDGCGCGGSAGCVVDQGMLVGVGVSACVPAVAAKLWRRRQWQWCLPVAVSAALEG